MYEHDVLKFNFLGISFQEHLRNKKMMADHIPL